MKLDSMDLSNFPITNTYFILFLAMGSAIGIIFVIFGCLYHRNETDAEYRERRETEDCVSTSCCCCLIITKICCICRR